MTEILFARRDDVDASAAVAASEAAAQSAAAAQQSAQDAAASVAEIGTAVEDAEAAAAAALVSADNAAASEAAAGGSATAAAGSASAAAGSASAASGSASAAAGSASAAAGSATTASTAATNAGNSATAAAGSASTASTAATNAGNSATAAAGSATTAGTAATNAGNSATAAAGSASAASTSATNAGNSATAAAGSASTAAAIAATIGSLDSLTDVVITTPTNGQALIYDSGTTTWVNGSGGGGGSGTVTSVGVTAPAAGITSSGGPITTSGNITLALADDLNGLENLGTIGIMVRTATNTFATRSLGAPSSGFGISQSAGIGGNPSFVLNDDLAAVEGLATTGIVRRTGTSAWSAGTLVANAELATMATGTIKANITGGTAAPADVTFSAFRGAIGMREMLTAARTYYVRTDGSDSNNGLANTAGGAFLTLQKAWDTIMELDGGGYATTIKVANGTYTAGIAASVAPLGTQVTIEGNTTTPASCVIAATSNAFTFTYPGTAIIIKGFKISSSSGSAISANQSSIELWNMDYGACAANHILSFNYSIISIMTNYTISGGADRHYSLINGYLQSSSMTVTLTGTPAFTRFIECSRFSYANSFSMTFTGAATGVRYNVIQNGFISTGGGGANYFPGNAAGTLGTGGQYT